jgi:transposase
VPELREDYPAAGALGIARGRAGPGLLAHVLFAKYALHLLLTRQGATYAREGIALDVSTLADWVGASAATLMPLVEAVRALVFAAERLNADDTTVPVLAVGRTRTGRLWTYVRDDRPFGRADPPAAAYFYSPDRTGKHPEQHLASWTELLQADAYAGFNRLYEADRRPGPIVEAACWAHARRKFFDLARLNKAPIALEAVARIDVLFGVERDINGLSPEERRKVRNERSRARVDALGTWLHEQYARLSPHNQIAKAIAYSLNAWDALICFLDDGRLCMTNNAAKRAMRCIAVGRNTQKRGGDHVRKVRTCRFRNSSTWPSVASNRAAVASNDENAQENRATLHRTARRLHGGTRTLHSRAPAPPRLSPNEWCR